ncbi:4Fe-4S dicluster domain-containing protein [Guggenheimella bovis]
MKESYSSIIAIRRRVFAEIARIAYDNIPLERLIDSTYRIIPDESFAQGTNVFQERAIVGERLRMGLGLNQHLKSNFLELIEPEEIEAVKEVRYEVPLVQVIKFACEACPTKQFIVTDQCKKCTARPCTVVCPVGAVSMGQDRSHIDQEKCIKCGRCKETCPYSAIIKSERACASVCGVNAIKSDETGRAVIDSEKCVSCGRCITQCPFGAIADKSQIYQLVNAIQSDVPVDAMIAPSFVGQFGEHIHPMQIIEGLSRLGFRHVIEVGLGADFTTLRESREFVERVPHEIPYMGTSCCASWSMLVEKHFPDEYKYISDSASPMIESAKYHKAKDPNSKIVFIGPCISKKVEALRENVAGFVDFVITYEELMGLFAAKNINLEELPISRDINDDASTTARGYGIAGGVAGAVKSAILEIDPTREVKIEGAHTLQECVKMMRMAKAGQRNGYLLEGMACPGGCIGGPGTISSFNRVRKEVNKFMKESKYPSPFDNVYIDEKLRNKELHIEEEK